MNAPKDRTPNHKGINYHLAKINYG